MNEFHYNLNLSKSYNFGVEIEFSDINLSTLYIGTKKEKLPIQFLLGHKKFDLKFDKWYLDTDSTITIKKDKHYIGGELSSKILKDQIQDWIELKNVCQLLKKYNAKINEFCSSHINIDCSEFFDNSEFFEIFSKIIAIFENDIALFFMGEKYSYRETMNDYAQLLRFRLLSKINEINFCEKEQYLYNLCHKTPPTFFQNDAINFQNISKKKIIEIRYPNGTLNPKVIQNNINFCLKIIDSILENKWDKTELNKMIEEEIEKKDYLLDFIFMEPKYNKFEYLIKKISTTESDNNDIMIQYEKVLSTRNKIL